MKSTIHLIRHGITEGNLKRWHYGWADIPLAAEGVENLRQLCEEDIYPRPEEAACYTSGMVRTEQTFKEIYGDVPHQVLPKLKEMNFGDFEKKTYYELKDNPDYQKWITDKTFQTSIPGGESKSEFYNRVQNGFEELVNLHRREELKHRHNKKDTDTICVCHGGVISCIMIGQFGADGLGEFINWIPDPGRGYSITVEDGKCVSYEKI